MTTHKKKIEPLIYKRKPFFVKEIQVTAENLKDVAEWCGGTVEVESFRKQRIQVPFIKVNVKEPRSDKQTKAYITDHILIAGSGFKVYTDSAFKNSFDLAQDEEFAQDTADRAAAAKEIRDEKLEQTDLSEKIGSRLFVEAHHL
jgi:hypothetical protein